MTWIKHFEGNKIMTEKIFTCGGYEHITALISKAIENGSRTAKVTGNWEINTAVRLPSNFTLILENCHLRLADGCYANIFVNEHNETDIGRTSAGTDTNISIIGRGEAILDGGEPNDVCEKVPYEERVAPIWKNNLILFTNVKGFKVAGLHLRNQRWWATNFIYCSHGYLGNLDFCANDTAVDGDGNVYHGLIRSKYSHVLVKNADGIDLRQGCHDIVIENITGFTEDDTVALTALNGRMERNFVVEGYPSDICNVLIRNVRASAYCSIVRLLNQGEIKLHDIDIDGIYDDSEGSKHLDNGRYAVRVGDTHMYGSRHATREETYNISVKNVYGRGEAVLALAGEMDNLVLYGIEAADGTKMLLDNRG